MTSLYDINKEILELIKDRDEFDTDTFKDTFEALALERGQKIDSWVGYIKSLERLADEIEGSVDAYRERVKEADERAERYRNQAKNSANGLRFMLEPREKHKGINGELAWRSSKSVKVEIDASLLPDEYKRVRIEPDKKAIKEALDSGGHVEGCTFENKLSLTVK